MSDALPAGQIHILHWANRIADCRDSGEGRVLLALADHCNVRGETFVSAETLARECRAGRRTVEAKLRALAGRGVIDREKRPNRPTTYRLPDAETARKRLSQEQDGPAKTADPAPDGPAKTADPAPDGPAIHADGPANSARWAGKFCTMGRQYLLPEGDSEGDTRRSLEESSFAYANDSFSRRGEVDEAISIFNAAAAEAGWPKAQKMTDARAKAIRARLADAGGLEGWRVAVEKAKDSDFLCGRTAKPFNGFSLDWMAKQSNFTKIMEGNFDDRNRKNGHANTDAGGGSISRAARFARTPRSDCF